MASSEEFFYQLGLRQFGNYHRIKLDPAPALRTLVRLAVNAEEGTNNSTLSKAEIVDVCVMLLCALLLSCSFCAYLQILVARLVAKRDMLQEYFSTFVSEDGVVETLPLLLKGYTPNLDKLPLFLMRLGAQVRLWWMNVKLPET